MIEFEHLKLQHALSQGAINFPDRTAIQYRERRVSYSQLSSIVAALGNSLGLAAGSRVLLLLPDGIPAYLFHLLIFLSGATVIPISTKSTTSAIQALCQRVHPHFVITNKSMRIRHLRAVEDRLCILVASEKAETVWGFDYSLEGPAVSRETRSNITDTSSEARLVVFTSGSTGEPKGVCLSESNILAAASMMVSFLSLGATRKSLVTVPLYDYYGFIQIYGHILAGSGYVLGENIAFLDSLFKRILEEKITDLVLVPYTLRQILKMSTARCREAIGALSYITSSSDVLTPEALQQTFSINTNLQIFNIYGLTEAGRACYRRIDSTSAPSNSIGKPSPGVQVAIEGPEGEPGELILRGPNVMLGYLQKIIEDRITFDPCKEIRTGDLARYDENGDIILLGRRDHMFNVMGSKIHPSEIERIALQIPGVTDAIARSRRGQDDEFIISLDVVLANGDEDLTRIRDYIRQNLSTIFCPQEIRIVPEIKRTELGSKVIRNMGVK